MVKVIKLDSFPIHQEPKEFFSVSAVNLSSIQIHPSCLFKYGIRNILFFSLCTFRYNVVFMFLTYFLPIGSMTFTYARVGIELWGSQSIGECTQRQLENIKSKRRVSLLNKYFVFFPRFFYPSMPFTLISKKRKM